MHRTYISILKLTILAKTFFFNFNLLASCVWNFKMPREVFSRKSFIALLFSPEQVSADLLCWMLLRLLKMILHQTLIFRFETVIKLFSLHSRKLSLRMLQLRWDISVIYVLKNVQSNKIMKKIFGTVGYHKYIFFPTHEVSEYMNKRRIWRLQFLTCTIFFPSLHPASFAFFIWYF